MKKWLLFVLVTSALMFGEAKAQDGMLGEVRLFAGNFEPRGWAFCDGQELNVSDYSALFSIIGTYYGGDGRNTFALPNLQGAVPVGAGKSNANNTFDVGENVGIGGQNNGVKGLGMHYIICTSGTFPSRN